MTPAEFRARNSKALNGEEKPEGIRTEPKPAAAKPKAEGAPVEAGPTRAVRPGFHIQERISPLDPISGEGMTRDPEGIAGGLTEMGRQVSDTGSSLLERVKKAYLERLNSPERRYIDALGNTAANPLTPR